jgi:hypothetical protein
MAGERWNGEFGAEETGQIRGRVFGPVSGDEKKGRVGLAILFLC